MNQVMCLNSNSESVRPLTKIEMHAVMRQAQNALFFIPFLCHKNDVYLFTKQSSTDAWNKWSSNAKHNEYELPISWQMYEVALSIYEIWKWNR